MSERIALLDEFWDPWHDRQTDRVELMRMLSLFPLLNEDPSASNSVTDNDSADLFVPVKLKWARH